MQVECRNLRDPLRFEEVWNEYAEKIYRYAVIQLRSKEDADDVTSTTFIRLWGYACSHDTVIDHLPAFIYRIARHCIVDAVRRRRPMASIEEMHEAGVEFREPRHGIEPERIADIEILRTGLDKLKLDDRELLIWRFIEGIPVYEIAGMLSLSENAASVRIHRALGRLRLVMERTN